MILTQRRLQHLWLKALLFALFGYFLLGKGFAYLFFGEMILVFGFLIFLLSRRIMLLFSDAILLVWSAFALWGIYRTLPYISKYHFDALRDAVIWGYGVFAVLIVAFVNESSQISRGLDEYRKFLRWYLPIIPVLLIVSLTIGGALPTIPWSDGVGILHLKAGDVAVTITSAALFLLIFPSRRERAGREGVSIFRTIGIIGWCLTAPVILVVNRGGTAGMFLALILVSILRMREIAWKIAAVGIFGAILGLGLLLAVPTSLTIAGKSLDPGNVIATVASIAGGSGKGTGHESTAAWRLAWWGNIVHETFQGPYFWKGRGFGVNLAVADGPIGTSASEEEVKLRSPHNGSMTILARMGVPGFTLWLLLNLIFAIRLLKAQRSAARSGSKFWSGLYLWILASWLATLTNLTFDVYLEGPQGGIWFWSLIGFGVAAVRVQAYEARQLVERSRPKRNDVITQDDSMVHA